MEVLLSENTFTKCRKTALEKDEHYISSLCSRSDVVIRRAL